MRTLSACFALLCIFAFIGCRTARPLAAYKADNIHRAVNSLPADLRRVALLPIACDSSTADMEEECRAFASILSQELIATRKFEVVGVSPAALSGITGRGAWAGVEILPPHFFETVRQDSGCDAVFFAEITAYKPFSPMAIGWRFKLVDAKSKKILWATDEIFDTSVPAVANAARQFDSRIQQPGPGRFERFLDRNEPEDHWAVRNSPRRFGQYTVASLLTTLPER